MHEPVIVIAGREWRVPLLAPRQNRIVVPALMRLGTAAAEQYDLLLDIVLAALTRGHPGIVREQFEDWPIATHELLHALPVIAAQTGFGLGRNSVPRLDRGTQSIPPDWDAIIAEVVNFLPGTTPDYWEDALTMPRLQALREQCAFIRRRTCSSPPGSATAPGPATRTRSANSFAFSRPAR